MTFQGLVWGVAAVAAAMINGAVLVAAPMAARAQDAAQQVPAAEATWTRWFVELKSPPAAEGTSLATLRNEKAAEQALADRGR